MSGWDFCLDKIPAPGHIPLPCSTLLRSAALSSCQLLIFFIYFFGPPRSFLPPSSTRPGGHSPYNPTPGIIYCSCPVTMQCSFATLFCLLGLASAAPSPQWIVPRQENATAGATPAAAAGTTELTFTGAGASVKVTAARDGSIFQTRGSSSLLSSCLHMALTYFPPIFSRDHP